MNWIILFLTCFTGSVAVCYGVSCRTASDCKSTHCCVASSALELRFKGVCMKLSREGRICSEPDSALDYFGGKFVKHCPCKENLVCRPKNLKEGINDQYRFLRSLRCQKPETTPKPQTQPEPETVVPSEPVVDEIISEEPIDEETAGIAKGPGGEPPRDDDCQNWEYPC